MQGKIYTFPSKFVFYKQLGNHEEIKNQVYPVIQKDSLNRRLVDHKEWECKVITSFFEKNSLNLFSQFPLFIQSFWGVWGEMMNNIYIRKAPDGTSYSTYPASPVKITEAWYNIYKKGYNQDPHVHSFSDFSVIYILNAVEPNKTIFFDHNFLASSMYKTEHMKEGTLMIFPSNLSHYVAPVEEDNRITLAMNIRYS